VEETAMSHRFLKAFVLVALSCCLSGRARAGEVTVTTVGNPTFQAVDFHLLSAPIGTAASGYAEFQQTGLVVLPPPYYKLDPAIGITPDQPHPGVDFTTDLQQGVQAAGFVDKSAFITPEFSNGMGVFLMYMLVPGPGAPVGSSLDYASGPIIPNSIYPISQAFSTYFSDGTLADSSGSFSVNVLHPSLDGESHTPFFVADSFDFMTADRGIAHEFEYRIELRDAAGNGYDIKASFTVVPEPGSFLLLALGLACSATGAASWRGRAPR
jgi:hypothetical protein